jgi:hypothetical protein
MTQIAFSPSAVARVALAPGAAAAAMAGLAGLRGLLEPGPEVPAKESGEKKFRHGN